MVEVLTDQKEDGIENYVVISYFYDDHYLPNRNKLIRIVEIYNIQVRIEINFDSYYEVYHADGINITVFDFLISKGNIYKHVVYKITIDIKKIKISLILKIRVLYNVHILLNNNEDLTFLNVVLDSRMVQVSYLNVHNKVHIYYNKICVLNTIYYKVPFIGVDVNEVYVVLQSIY